ncbi:MAG: 50S ribosomal protein L17 [Candidatus Levybacteria bacterium]|nr:50S ribosomal protein L17 [Candidatus Levybacteria bacterium]
MRKNVFGRRLKRNKNQRKALFKSLMSSLILNNRVKTTEAKAKSIKGQAEKLITAVKKKGEKARNDLYIYLTPNAIEKLVTDVAHRFNQRQGGYTRIIKLQKRFDSSRMVLLEWVETERKGEEVLVSQPVSPEVKGKGQTKPKTKPKTKAKEKTK